MSRFTRRSAAVLSALAIAVSGLALTSTAGSVGAGVCCRLQADVVSR